MASHETAAGRHVVIAGASFAGLGAAYTLRQQLDPRDRVTVIAPTDTFVFAPSLVWAALGRTSLRSSFALEPALRRQNIGFLQSAVQEVRAGDRTVRSDGGDIEYDHLLIATGGRPDTSSIPGLAGEFRAASWIVGEDSAMEAQTVLRELFKNPGPLVVGAAQGAAYVSAAYELVLALDAALRAEGLRDRVPMTFVTAEPYLGHLGFGQDAAREKLENLFAERDIESRVGVEVEYVHAHEVKLAHSNALPAQVMVIMPPFTGAADIWKSAKLTDPTGLVPVTPQYRHTDYPEVWAAGVASHFAEPVQPLGFGQPPHTGYLALHMGEIAGRNIAAALGRGTPASRTLPRLLDVRVLDGGSTGMLLTSRGDTDLRNRAWTLPGAAAHRLKSAIERYLVWRLRTGRTDLP